MRLACMCCCSRYVWGSLLWSHAVVQHVLWILVMVVLTRECQKVPTSWVSALRNAGILSTCAFITWIYCRVHFFKILYFITLTFVFLVLSLWTRHRGSYSLKKKKKWTEHHIIIYLFWGRVELLVRRSAPIICYCFSLHVNGYLWILESNFVFPLHILLTLG